MKKRKSIFILESAALLLILAALICATNPLVGLEGAGVSLTWNGSGNSYSNSVTTNAEGFYSMTIANGSVKLDAMKPGYVSNFTQFTASGDMRVNLTLIKATTNAVIKGYVMDNATHIALSDASIAVYWYAFPGNTQYYAYNATSTDGSGYYEISVLAGNITILSASKTGYVSESAYYFIVSAGDNWRNFSLAQQVTYDDPPNGAWVNGTVRSSSGGSAISGANVTITWMNLTDFHTTTRTDTTNGVGYYNINVPMGYITYSSSSHGVYFSNSTAIISIVSAASGATANVSMYPKPSEDATVSGYILVESEDTTTTTTTTTTTLPTISPNITACWLNETDVLQGTIVGIFSNVSNGTYEINTVWWVLNSTFRYASIDNTTQTWWSNIDTSSLLGNYTDIVSYANDTLSNLDNETCGSLNVYTTTTTTTTTLEETTTTTATTTTTIPQITCNCSTCDDCEDKINNASCQTINLIANISEYSGTCINNPESFSNKIFDCLNNTMDGNHGGDGVYALGKANITIRNCVLTDWAFGIHFYTTTNSMVLNNNLSSSTDSIKLEYWSSSNLIADNIASNNTYKGINLEAYSDNNRIANNTANGNFGHGGINTAQSSNNTIINNVANFNYEYGINLENNSNNTVINNTVNSNSYYGIYIRTDSKNNTVIGSTANNNYHGIFVASSSNNVICNNSLFANEYYGIYLSGTASQKNEVYNNTVRLSAYGIYLESGSNNTAIGNTVKANNNYGIYLYGTSNNTIANNIAENNTLAGIRLEHYAQNNMVENNSVSNNTDTGIFLGASSSNILRNNGVFYNTFGITLESSSYNTLTNNTANNNTFMGIYLYGTSIRNTISNNTAQSNWWFGLYLNSSSTSNVILSNTLCYNNQSDSGIDIYDEDSNTGDENICDTPNSWNDTGTIGCTYACGEVPVSTNSYTMLLLQGWNLISVPLEFAAG